MEGGEPTQEELRERIEEQLRSVRVQDLLVDSVASIVNLTARRIAKEDERDLEQARIGIDAIRALLDLIEGEAEVAGQVRTALSELQLLYARAAKGEPLGGGAPEPEEGTAETPQGWDPPPAQGGPPPGADPGPQGPPRSKLWTPGRD